MLQGPEGQLIFEDDDGKSDPITAEQLSVLLRQHHIPAIVLNACQSAMVDQGAKDPFASVAAAILKSGIRSVVAMAYSLYVSGTRRSSSPPSTATCSAPATWRGSAAVGPAADVPAEGPRLPAGPVSARRLAGPRRLSARALRLLVRGQSQEGQGRRRSRTSREARDTENPYGFIGRDGAVLALERAMHRKPAGLLIQGLGGVGKTTLARGFLQWLQATDGLGKGGFWFAFQDIRSAEFVFNRMGEALFGPQFIALR